jgi:hypothetical protein
MSFKQKSSPLKQGFVSGVNTIRSMASGIMSNVSQPPMTAAQIAFSNTPAGAMANGTPVANAISPGTAPVSSQHNRGQNWFGAVPTNTVGGGPQSVMQGTHGAGINRRDSHNTTYADRTNGGSTDYSNPSGGRSSMFSPFPQLKKEQMEYNKISPKAFSNSGTIEKMMGKAVPNSPFMQMVDPLTGLTIDPTMSQDPNAPLPPPSGVQTPTTPIYDINNY